MAKPKLTEGIIRLRKTSERLIKNILTLRENGKIGVINEKLILNSLKDLEFLNKNSTSFTRKTIGLGIKSELNNEKAKQEQEEKLNNFLEVVKESLDQESLKEQSSLDLANAVLGFTKFFLVRKIKFEKGNIVLKKDFTDSQKGNITNIINNLYSAILERGEDKSFDKLIDEVFLNIPFFLNNLGFLNNKEQYKKINDLYGKNKKTKENETKVKDVGGEKLQKPIVEALKVLGAKDIKEEEPLLIKDDSEVLVYNHPVDLYFSYDCNGKTYKVYLEVDGSVHCNNKLKFNYKTKFRNINNTFATEKLGDDVIYLSVANYEKVNDREYFGNIADKLKSEKKIEDIKKKIFEKIEEKIKTKEEKKGGKKQKKIVKKQKKKKMQK